MLENSDLWTQSINRNQLITAASKKHKKHKKNKKDAAPKDDSVRTQGGQLAGQEGQPLADGGAGGVQTPTSHRFDRVARKRRADSTFTAEQVRSFLMTL